MSDEMKTCPNCNSPYGYSLGNELYACPECDTEWNPDEKVEDEIPKILDSNGNELNDGDSVIVIKDLPVKGAPKPIKAGTKVKNIRLVDDNVLTTTGNGTLLCGKEELEAYILAGEKSRMYWIRDTKEIT
ncbi:unnamed protein product, partial [Cyprideis torosa]